MLRNILGPRSLEIINRVIEGEDSLQHHKALYDKLYVLLFQEMPYGTAKGRDGDPMRWIEDNLPNYL